MNNSAELKIRDDKVNRQRGGMGVLVLLSGIPANAWRLATEGHHVSLTTRLLMAGSYVIFAVVLARVWYVRCRRCRLLVWPTTFVVVNPFRKYDLARSDLLGYRHRWLTKRTITHIYVKGRWRGLWLVGLPANRVDELIFLLDIPYTKVRPVT
jgi:hypothetical protein